MLRIIISLFFGGVFGFLIATTLQSPPSTADIKAIDVKGFGAEKNNLQNELTQLKLENNQLKKLIQVTNDSTIKSTENKNTEASKPIVDGDCTQQVKAVLSALSEKDKVLESFRTMKSSHDFDQGMATEFNAEPRNDSWANSTENKLLSSFKNDTGLQAISISTVSCKSKTCELKVPTVNENTKNQVMETLVAQDLGKKLGFKNSSIQTAMEISSGQMTVYITDKTP